MDRRERASAESGSDEVTPVYTPQIRNAQTLPGIGQRGTKAHRLTEYDDVHHGKPPSVYSAQASIVLAHEHGACHGCDNERDLVNGYCELCRTLGVNERQCLNSAELQHRQAVGRRNSRASSWRIKPDDDDALDPALVNTLTVIHDYTFRHGYAPMYSEMMQPLGLASRAAVASRVVRLSKIGLVTYEPRKPRTLLVTEAGYAALVKCQRAGVSVEP